MPRAKVDYIVSFSSEDPDHPAANLLQESATGKRWLAAAGSGTASVVLQLSRAVKFCSLSIGAHRTALIEVLVGRSEKPQYEVLVPRCILQTPSDARRGLNPDRVRTFSTEQMTEGVREKSWDRVRLVCSQPYDKHCKFGLSFVHIFEPEQALPSPRPPQLTLGTLRRDSSDDEGFRPGALFEAHLLNATGSETLTCGSQIRQATSRALKNIPDTCMKLVKTPISKEKTRDKPPEKSERQNSSRQEKRDRRKEEDNENDETSKNVKSRNERNTNFDNAKAEMKPKEDLSSSKKNRDTSEKGDTDSGKRKRDKKSSSRDRKEGRKRQHENVSKHDQENDTDDEIEKFLRKQKKKKQDGDTTKANHNDSLETTIVTKRRDYKEENLTQQNQEKSMSNQDLEGTNPATSAPRDVNRGAKVLPMFLDGLSFALDDSVARAGFDEQLVRRYVLAYGGEIVESGESASYVLMGARAHAQPAAAPLRADWLWRCHRRQRRVPLDPYLLT